MNDKLLDNTPLKFGQYKGKTPNEIARDDPSYIVWMRANVLPAPCSRDLALDCEERLNGESDDELESWARDLANE